MVSCAAQLCRSVCSSAIHIYRRYVLHFLISLENEQHYIMCLYRAHVNNSLGNSSREESLFCDPICFKARRKRQTDGVDYVPIFFDELDFTDDQITACNGNNQCLFDLAVTNDAEFARKTKEAEESANATIAILSML